MTEKRTISRWRAASYHLAISAVIALGVLFAILAIWYPGGLFEVAGGRKLFLLIALVDVALGPLLTLIVYRHGKKGLAADLAVIASMQVAALVGGAWVLYESRPAWIVFVVDRFELVRANDILEAELPKARAPFNEISVGGPKLAGVRMPTDPDEQLRIAMSASRGVDVHNFPQYLVPYEAVTADVVRTARPLGELAQLNSEASQEVSALPAKFGRASAPELGWFPMNARKATFAAIVDARTGAYLGTAAFNPW